MCTLSWYPEGSGYHVFFNRDERRTRPPAHGPVGLVRKGVSYLAPTDPASSGTWIAANAYGVTICLLNRYSTVSAWGRGRRSRGQLVTHLADLRERAALDARLASERLTDFGQFTVVAFDPEGGRVAAWDGRDLATRTHLQPGLVETSSAVEGTTVEALRARIFDGDLSPERLTALHGSHEPRRGPESVCMHREDARTVSFSRVTVTETRVTMYYVPGPPCETAGEAPVHVNRAPSHSVG